MRLNETKNGTLHPVAAARKRMKISLRELADRTGMTHVGISHIETGRSPNPLRSTRKLLEAELGKIDWPSQNGHKP